MCEAAIEGCVGLSVDTVRVVCASPIDSLSSVDSQLLISLKTCNPLRGRPAAACRSPIDDVFHQRGINSIQTQYQD